MMDPSINLSMKAWSKPHDSRFGSKMSHEDLVRRTSEELDSVGLDVSSLLQQHCSEAAQSSPMGAVSLMFIRHFKIFMREHHPNMMALFEPRINGRIAENFISKLGFSHSFPKLSVKSHHLSINPLFFSSLLVNRALEAILRKEADHLNVDP
ncbi:hypothetical protein V6N11_027182 [Hibiscus sabdariffa]|uniref:Uncharacterized protein n=1 Tax=Hibiscus sabdariffa TaxID=183260 RepID=A0ABR2PG64_9ROSI